MSDPLPPLPLPIPPLTLDPVDVGRRALKALQGELRGILGDAVDTAADQLESVATYMPVHWRLIAEGREEEAAGNLQAIKATARLIARRYALRGATAIDETVDNVIETLARIGAVLLRGLLV